jgi:hypothetical protein
VSKRSIYRCPHCSCRVRSAPYVSLQDRHTRKVVRYHGNVAGCLQAATVEAQRRGPDEVILRFAHPRSCGDPAGKLSCKGCCFAGPGAPEVVLLATASPGEAKIVKVGEE